MIVYKGIKSINKFKYLIMSNGNQDVEIPLDNRTAMLIEQHLSKISLVPTKPVERGNEESYE